MPTPGFQQDAFQADAFQSGAYDLAKPTLSVRVDWGRQGHFADALADVTPRCWTPAKVSWTRGRSSDLSGEAKGAASFVLLNTDGRFSADRNWHDNPSFERGSDGWSAAAVAGVTQAGTSIGRVVDAATGGGTYAGEAVLTATQYSGVTFPIPYRFRAGVTYAVAAWLKSTAGNLNVGGGIGVIGDYGGFAGPITTSWAKYAGTWTPAADTDQAVFFVRTTTAASATVRLDAIQVNPGSAPNTYLEAPTKGDLVPGRPVLILAEYNGATYPQFFGYIQNLAPDPVTRTVAITCYDVLQRMSETDAVVNPLALTSWCARDYRVALLEQFDAAPLNLLPNPTFRPGLDGWVIGGTGGAGAWSLVHVPGDGPAGISDTCAEWYSSQSNNVLYATGYLIGPYPQGQAWTFSVYLRATSGAPTVQLQCGHDFASATTTTVALSTSWQRFTVRFTTQGSGTAASGVDGPPYLSILNGQDAAKTVRVAGAMVTQGPILWPYTERGTGRGPDLCQQGSFDGGGLNGWYRGFQNRITNYGFDTDTTGWATTADAFHTSGATLSWLTATWGLLGSGGMASLAYGGPGQGCHYAITGTFRAGVTYRCSLYSYGGGDLSDMEWGIGSNGTPTDYASVIDQPGWGGSSTWKRHDVTWTPSADRTDVHLYVKRVGAGGNTTYLDQAYAGEYDGAHVASVYDASWDLPAATRGVSARGIGTVAYDGSRSLAFTTTPEAGSGMAYSFHHAGVVLIGGLDYVLRLYLRATSSMPYRVLLAIEYGAPQVQYERRNWSSVEVTGTLTANTWTPIILPWRPVDTKACPTPVGNEWAALLAIEQTDATARDVYVDAVRLEAGLTPTDWVLPQWDLDAELDSLSAIPSSGNVLSGLADMNNVVLSRHWIAPKGAEPWYAYVTESRDTTAAKVPAESITDATIHSMTGVDLDRGSIANMVRISVGSTVNYVTDMDSIARYGLRPATLQAPYYGGDQAAIGQAIVDRYANGTLRPHLTRRNQFPSQLARELNDVLNVTSAKLGLTAVRFSIQSLTTTVDLDGLLWETKYDLEEHPY